MENKERKKVSEILDSQYMSSKESEGDNAMKIRPLPWLGTAANQFKKMLDDKKAKQLSSQSKRQTKRKIWWMNLTGKGQLPQVEIGG